MCGGEIKTDKLLRRLMATLKERVYSLSGPREVMHNAAGLFSRASRGAPLNEVFNHGNLCLLILAGVPPLGDIGFGFSRRPFCSSLMFISQSVKLMKATCLTRSGSCSFDMLTRSAWRTAENITLARFVTIEHKGVKIGTFWTKFESNVLKYVW